MRYVGHPLPERVNRYSFLSRDEFYKKFNLDEKKDILLDYWNLGYSIRCNNFTDESEGNFELEKS